MTLKPSLHRWTLAALLVATGALTLAPLAQADPGWRRWKGDNRGRWSQPVSRVVLRDRGHDGPGPVFAGLIGGMILGAALSHAQPVYVHEPVVVHERVCAPPPPMYRYEDAYGNRWWDSLDECTDAAWGRYGPRVIKVVDARDGDCVDTLYWRHGRWISDRGDDDWDD